MDKSTDINSQFKANSDVKPANLLLHACCGPCSLEPLRVLSDRDITPVIYFSNSNIAPFEEYELRRRAITEYASSEGIEIVFDDYDNAAWTECAGRIGEAEEGSERRRARCRACYRMRLESSARFASEWGFDALGTTLTVSPYQYGDIICEELERACEKYGIKPFYEDYSPLYSQATRRSKENGMYRQNYCGCLFSLEEAAAQRKMRKAVRDAEREKRKAKRAIETAEAERKLQEKREQRRRYDDKQARKRAVLKALREQRRDTDKD